MPTSLVSTGVQFPDSTIQTTAATGSPNYTTTGTTLAWMHFSNSSLPPFLSAVGSTWASSNIITTPPTIIATPSAEQQMNMPANQVFPSASNAAAFWGATTGGGVQLSNPMSSIFATANYRLVYDGFTNRYSFAPAAASFANYSGSSVYFTDTYTTDFITWLGYTRTTLYTNDYYISAFNHYTGTRILTSFSASSQVYYPELYRKTAATAYDNGASFTNTINVNSLIGGTDIRAQTPKFIDTGTQSTSRMCVLARENGGGTQNTYFLYSTGTNDGAAGTWTSVAIGGRGIIGRLVGSAAEIMFYGSSSGISRSLDLGNTWTNYNYGDSSSGGTSNSNFPQSATWNNSRWLTINSSSGGLSTKPMDSSTTWTYCSNAAGLGSFIAVAYNPTQSAWLVITNGGRIYYNTNSDPSAGSWTQVTQISANQGIGVFSIGVMAAKTFNFY